MPLPAAPARNPRQLRLFALDHPWEHRFGPAFFRGIPRQPGVYRFYDHDDKLLYVGQSGDLRARIRSYRHLQPERAPRRNLRLVQRTVRIEWETCGSAAAAIERERVLLLAHRPRFNRAGIWQALPWWLRLTQSGDSIHFTLIRESAPPEGDSDSVFGPFLAGFPYRYAALVRVAHHQLHPHIPLIQYPAGYLCSRRTSETLLVHPTRSQEIAASLRRYFAGESAPLISLLEQDCSEDSKLGSFERAYWSLDLELLRERPALSLLLPSTPGAS